MTLAHPNPTVPSSLLSAYRAAGGPPVSALLRAAMRAWLRDHGHAVPAETAPHPQTGKATAARAVRRATTPPSCGANVDRRGAFLVCLRDRDHGGDHNTARDGSGDSFGATA